MAKYIPNELALVRSTIHQANELAEMLADDDNDHSQLLNQITSILQQEEAGVDLLIELKSKLESNGEFYNERSKAYKAYSASMANALVFVNQSIINLHECGEIPNRLEGSAESLCIQNNPVKVECLVNTNDVEQMEYLCVEHPHIFKKVVSITYSYDSAYIKSNQDKPEVHKYFNFTQGKHVRVRRATKPSQLRSLSEVSGEVGNIYYSQS